MNQEFMEIQLNQHTCWKKHFNNPVVSSCFLSIIIVTSALKHDNAKFPNFWKFINLISNPNLAATVLRVFTAIQEAICSIPTHPNNQPTSSLLARETQALRASTANTSLVKAALEVSTTSQPFACHSLAISPPNQLWQKVPSAPITVVATASLILSHLRHSQKTYSLKIMTISRSTSYLTSNSDEIPRASCTMITDRNQLFKYVMSLTRPGPQVIIIAIIVLIVKSWCQLLMIWWILIKPPKNMSPWRVQCLRSINFKWTDRRENRSILWLRAR